MAKHNRIITRQELLDALKGVEAWISDIRTVVAALPASTRITMAVSGPGGGTRPVLDGCPPPEDCGDEEEEKEKRISARKPLRKK